VQVKVSAGTKSSNTLLERVLALDRSDESVSDQIKEACRLVGVNFDDSYVTHGADPGKSYISQQQHLDEWTLRWLLKRMLSEEIQLDSPCLNYLAWLLLDVLTSRLSTRKVAILFDAHNFCTGLQKTLQWLLEYSSREHGVPLTDQSLQSLPEAGHRRESSSSVTLVDTNEPSRKRKRGAATSKQEGKKMETEDISRLQGSIGRVMLRIFQNIKSSESSILGIPGYDQVHMWLALKPSLEQVALLLGSSLSLSKQCFTHFEKEDPSKHRLDAGGVTPETSLVIASTQMWQYVIESLTASETEDKTTRLVFFEHVLVPAAVLLATMRIHPSRRVTRDVQKVLVDLLQRNFVPEVRAVGLLQSKTKMTPGVGTSPLQELLVCLENAVKLQTLKPHKGDEDPEEPVFDRPPIFDAIPHLLEVAVDATRIENAKQRSTETPWIQEVFWELVSYCSIHDRDSPPGESKKYYHTQPITKMLETLAKQKIPLHKSHLEVLCMDIAQLSHQNLDLPGLKISKVNWEILGLCFKIDPRTTVKQSEILEALLNHLMSFLMWKSNVSLVYSPTAEYIDKLERYISVREEVILPILDGFVMARDMLGFLDVWRKQIERAIQFRFEASELNQVLHEGLFESIWEDDKLLVAAIKHAPISLTRAQIEQVCNSTLESHTQNYACLPEFAFDKLGADLITLEFGLRALNGRTGNLNTELLAQTFDQLAIFIQKGSIPLYLPWRIARVLSVIINFGGLSRDSLEARRVTLHRCLVPSTKKDISEMKRIAEAKKAGKPSWEYANILHLVNAISKVASSHGASEAFHKAMKVAIDETAESFGEGHLDNVLKYDPLDHCPPTYESFLVGIANAVLHVAEILEEEDLKAFIIILYSCASAQVLEDRRSEFTADGLDWYKTWNLFYLKAGNSATISRESTELWCYCSD
jgi:hypothetical protein